MTVSPPRVFVRGRLYAPTHPGATALVSQGDRIVFVGDDDGARRWSDGATEVDLQGRLVTPAFVDAHLHAVQTGLVAAGLDLHDAASRTDVLDRLAAYAAQRPAGVIVGQGWDERAWPDPRPPTGPELDRAAGGRLVYLARVDVHSAVVSTPVLDRLPGVSGTDGFGVDGMLTKEAHHRSRILVNAMFDDAERRRAARRALRQAVSLGVGSVHELGGPHLGPIEDLNRVRDVGAELGVRVVTYWGEPASQAAIGRARAFGAVGLAGDLCIDGSIGSRTAALHAPYADAETCGSRYLDDDQITEHVIACTRAGLQAGFHCIGDDAVAAAVAGLRRAAERLGVERVRAARHRLEHLEMVAADDIPTLAGLGVVASVQPAFDALWGRPGELYETRLGSGRAQTMNPLGSLHRAGVPLAFGTDAPVTPPAGWAMVRAAAEHSRSSERLGTVEAFAVATSGGHWAGGIDLAGTLRRGALASFAVWDVRPALPSPAVPDLPDFGSGAAIPGCVLTVAGGRIAFRLDAEPVG
ncbi:MAG TPA: amidohydrolase family protein [Propionibacteriaceae bacterium]|nr:amidohydrolase family protein [Propionibacteriaceae bacterium]